MLQSHDNLRKHMIRGRDGDIGRGKDFLFDDDQWAVHYLDVDTGKWLQGKEVLAAPVWIEAVSWSNGKLQVLLSRETIRGSPEHDPSVPVNREYERWRYDYYGRPVYWEQATTPVRR